MFKFITSKPFWVNLLAAIVLGFLLIFLVLQLLGWITKHGEYLTVPAVMGKNTKEAVAFLESKGFEVVIQDSIFTDTAKRGIVLKQLPDANATVKINRTVFLTVNRYTPPMITMPLLKGKSLSFALEILKRNHLQLGDTTFVTDWQKGSVLKQLYNGKEIESGAKIQWGSAISLVVARGVDETPFPVPNLVGLTYAEAKVILDSAGIVLATVNPYDFATISDTNSAYIIKQLPEHRDENNNLQYIRSGQLMDIYINPTMINLKDSLSPKSLAP